MQRADLEGRGGQTASNSPGRRTLPVINNLKPQKSENELAIEEELSRFEAEQRAALGLNKATEHWSDANPQHFTRAQRPKTTVLVGGLTVAHDYLISATLEGLGYNVETLDNPDSSALQLGKEFGNRGQCNPTYFNVGNLVKRLNDLRAQGLSAKQIVDRYLFVMPGACGPCRFGSYVTEYRKALRDAGFDGFRVMLFQQQGGLKQVTGDDPGLDLNPQFFISLLFAIMVGDAVNAIGYRMRPYETEQGTTDRALGECKRTLAAMLRNRSNPLVALLTCRRILRAVAVDRTQVKPKVAVIGEFWAMTTEGDGNYGLQRFLEQEGAEVDIQIVTNWLLYNIWEHRWDTKQRMTLRQEDAGRKGLAIVGGLRIADQIEHAEVRLRLLDVGNGRCELGVAQRDELLADHLAALDAAAGHPQAEGIRMMIAAGDFLEALAVFAERGATELAAPHDERGVEQAALFEVLQKRGDGLIDHLAIVRELRIEAAVMIPRGVDDVHEAHAALDHASRIQTVAREGLVVADAAEVALDRRLDAIHAIRIERGLRFAAEVDQFRR